MQGSGSLNMLVVGNSYGHRAFHAIVNFLQQDAKEIRLVTSGHCQPFLNLAKDEPPKHQKRCSSYVQNTVNLVKEVKPDVLFIIFL